MAPGEGWGVAAHVNYLSPLSGLRFGFIVPDTENKVNHVLWVFSIVFFANMSLKFLFPLKELENVGPRSYSEDAVCRCAH